MPATTQPNAALCLLARRILCGLAIVVLPCLAAAHEATVRDQQGDAPKGYVPPLVSNGNLSLQIDYQGGQSQKAYVELTPGIFWAGRRYGPPKDALVPFGHFLQELSAGDQVYDKPTSWQQSLDTDAGLVRCQCDYGDALRVETTAFVPLDQDMVVVHKRIVAKTGAPRSVRMQFKYQFSPPGKENVPPRRVAMGTPTSEASGIDIPYELDGYQRCAGLICLMADAPVAPRIDRQTFRLAAEMALDPAKPAEITFYLLAADSLDGKDHRARAARMKSLIQAQGHAGLLSAHQRKWAAYWAESYVRLPVERMENAYYTAQYHLRINTTKWSIPVALFNKHWAGRYFAWDETFAFLGLASSNHLAISQRVPDFRHRLLPVVLRRTAHYGRPESYGARYVWETLEDGGEGAPPGFWIDHVFHMGNIALSAWYQYLYNGDLEYLKAKSYPIIKECATFYEKQMIYEAPNGQLIFGKCTDLERLGPARLNPFLTSCSAIFSLETAAKAARLLKLDEDRAAQWVSIAGRLRESLPHDGQRYIPYPGCKDVSIAVLGGLFPYPVFGPENALQKNAAYGFLGEGAKAGNMYPMGESICAWYGGWMACSLVALGDRERPAKLLSEVADGTGHFAEIFEINEAKVVMRPWFSTAEGNYVYAVNQMLLDCRDEQIRIAPSVPDAWNDFAYKLPCYGNLLATVAVQDGRLVELNLTPGDPATRFRRTVVIPQRLLAPQAVNRAAVTATAVRDGCLWLDVNVQGPTTLLAPR